jgi:ribosomal protein L7/L12
MTSNDIYERLGVLEARVQYLYEKTGVAMPDLQTLARSQVSPRVQQLLAAGDKMGAIKAYREETNLDLAAAKQAIESL